MPKPKRRKPEQKGKSGASSQAPSPTSSALPPLSHNNHDAPPVPTTMTPTTPHHSLLRTPLPILVVLLFICPVRAVCGQSYVLRNMEFESRHAVVGAAMMQLYHEMLPLSTACSTIATVQTHQAAAPLSKYHNAEKITTTTPSSPPLAIPPAEFSETCVNLQRVPPPTLEQNTKQNQTRMSKRYY